MKSSRRGDSLNSKCTELKISCACANHVITQAVSICHTRPGRGQRVKFTGKLQVSRLCQKKPLSRSEQGRFPEMKDEIRQALRVQRLPGLRTVSIKTKGARDINKGSWHLVEAQMEVYGYGLRQSSYLRLSRRKNYL